MSGCPGHAPLGDLYPESVPLERCPHCGQLVLPVEKFAARRAAVRASTSPKRFDFMAIRQLDRTCALCGNTRLRLQPEGHWACVACHERYLPVATAEGAAVEQPDDAEAKLRGAIAKDPDDDVPRAALADLLLERGDPRGEFLRLQLDELQRGPSLDRAARINELWRLHAVRWVPRGVDPAKCEFRRGLLFRAAWAPSTSPLHEGWATVEELEVPLDIEIGARELSPFAAPSLRALRRVSRLGPTRLGWLLQQPPPRLQSLGLFIRGHWRATFLGELEALLARLPSLVELDLEEEHPASCQFGPGLPELVTRLGTRLSRLWVPAAMGLPASQLAALLRQSAPNLTVCLRPFVYGNPPDVPFLEVDGAKARVRNEHTGLSTPGARQVLDALFR